MPNWKGIVGRGFRPEEFKKYVGTLRFADWRPQFAVVHNTSEPRLSQWHSHPGEVRMRNLESYYRDEQHWSAGPHLFVADDLIWVFTPLTTSGVHSPSWNGVAWGIELVGEYDEEPFNPAVRENAVDALAALYLCRGLDAATIHFHKEDPRTTHTHCPGRNVDKADLIARVEARMNSDMPGEHVPADNYLDIGATRAGEEARGPRVHALKSELLAADPALVEVAATKAVLIREPGKAVRVPGIATAQKALNMLAERFGLPVINLGRAGKNAGFFGNQTERSIRLFQKKSQIGVDGRIGDDTLHALDEALSDLLAPRATPIEGPASAAPLSTPPGPFIQTLAKVFNRGNPKPDFLQELVTWARTATDEIFVDKQTAEKDVYASVIEELGPFGDTTHRKACLLEVMRVLAGFESSWKWNAGIDITRAAKDTPENSEAGAWQVSSDSLSFGQDLKDLVKSTVGSYDGIEFQKAMKTNHPLAMEYVARLMRHTMRHNGPLYKDRSKFKGKLRDKEQSIYPWLSRDAVVEFQKFLA